MQVHSYATMQALSYVRKPVLGSTKMVLSAFGLMRWAAETIA